MFDEKRRRDEPLKKRQVRNAAPEIPPTQISNEAIRTWIAMCRTWKFHATAHASWIAIRSESLRMQ
eukprot:10860268-Heterocapsa_arctica.AAC.1